MKKLLSVSMTIVMLISVVLPILNVVAYREQEQVTIEAKSSNPITIEEDEYLPDEDDYDGALQLSAGYYDIERDFSQSAIITVTNTSDLSVEYYLTVSNVYNDIYLNFVRSGSPEIPLVIAPGETQEIQLDIFAQNATQGYYEFPIYANTIVDGSGTVASKTTAYVSCPVVNLDVSLTKISEDPNTLAQIYSLKNNGNAVSDIEVSLKGELYDYVLLTPINEYVYMNRNEVIEFTAMPDLTKMKVNNVTKIEGQIVVSAGGSSRYFDAEFDTKGQEITTITVGELVAMQMNGFAEDSVQSKDTGMGTIKVPSNNNQCTNAGKVTTKVRIPSSYSSMSTKSNSSSGVRIFLTSRMYGGGYVNNVQTNYDYYINGVKVATSCNSGLTEVSIVELPTDNIKFGAMNTIVRDYDTNPGSHFVTANTEISIMYPGETPISFIGSPKSLPDYRSLPDFAVYTENIFSSTDNIIVGKESDISVNLYNRGSAEGTFNITIRDSKDIIYSEENRYLDAFSGDTISFKWTPDSNKETVTITLENTTEGIPEDVVENNTADKVFTARERVAPQITAITPDYAVEGEAVIYADVSNYVDVVGVDFYVDDVLFTGEIKNSTYGGAKRYWINDKNMTVGPHTIRVAVSYADSDTTTTTVERTADFTVFAKDWNKYEFNLDENVGYAKFYLYNSVEDSSTRLYNVYRDGAVCSYEMSKAVYDHMEDYSIIVVADNAILFKALTDEKALLLDDCNKINFVNEDIDVYEVMLEAIDGFDIYSWLYCDKTIYVTPGKYSLSVDAGYMDQYNYIDLEADALENDVDIDLLEYFNLLDIKFVDEIEGYIETSLVVKMPGEDYYENDYLDGNFDGEKYIYNLSDYYIDAAEEILVLVRTDDILFVDELDISSGKVNESFKIDKSKLQKISLSAGGSVTDFGIMDVEISTDKFTAWLNSDVIYVTPGEYDITVYCRDISDIDMFVTESDSIKYVETKSDKKANISVNIDAAYERYAKVFGNGIDKDKYISGSPIEVNKDVYTLNVNLSRNNSTYTVESVVDVTEKDASDITIDNSFNGEITNTFGTYKANDTLRIYLDNLKDTEGNKLVAFSSKDYEDNLYGYLKFTNVDDEDAVEYVWVELDNCSYFDIEVPYLNGIYDLTLVVSTESELRDLEGLTISKTELSLNPNRKYQLDVESNPQGIELSNLVWNSSDESIATVDQNGLVTINKLVKGSVVITVSTEDGLYSASCNITVKFNVLQWLIWFFTFGCLRDLFV